MVRVALGSKAPSQRCQCQLTAGEMIRGLLAVAGVLARTTHTLPLQDRLEAVPLWCCLFDASEAAALTPRLNGVLNSTMHTRSGTHAHSNPPPPPPQVRARGVERAASAGERLGVQALHTQPFLSEKGLQAMAYGGGSFHEGYDQPTDDVG